jgi:hypothetical protein
MNNRIFFGLTLFLLLMMAAAGGLWAQELKFDGYFNSGLGVVADNGDTDTYYKAFGVDSESNGYRFRLNGSYKKKKKNAGVRFRLQSQRNLTTTTTVPVFDTNNPATQIGNTTVTNSSGYLSMPYVYGWVGFFDSKLTLTGGIVMDSTWETVDWYWIDDQGEGLGLLLKAEPVKGLNLGVGVYTISQQSGGNNNILNFGGALPNFRDITPKAKDAKYTFNAAYTLPDMFRLSVSFRTKNQAAWPATTPAPNYLYSGREETSQFIGEFRLLKVKGLTTVIVGVFDNLESFSEKGNILLTETFAYKVSDDLNLGFNAAQFLYNRIVGGNVVDTDPALLFNLWGSYAFGTVVPRLDMVYFWGGQSKSATSAKQWERRGFVARGGMPGEGSNNNGKKGVDDDYSVFSVRPSVKISLDSRIFLEIGDIVNFDFANVNGAYKTVDDANKKSRLTNVFYIDLKFSF